MSLKLTVSYLLMAGAVAGASAVATDWRDFKDLAARTAMADQAAKPGSKCPLSKPYMDGLDLDVLSVCVAYGLPAMEAARRYPALATKVFGLYGEDPRFRSVFERYGHQVVPVVGYFFENGSKQYQVSQGFSGAVQRIWQGQLPTWPEQLNKETIGLMAIHELDERGPELLAEFEIVDGRAKRKPFQTVVLGTKNFFLGGIQNVETIVVRGERSLTWGDVGGAALDVAAMAGGVGLLAKEARAADVFASRGSVRAVSANAYRTLRTVGNVALGPVGNLALLYIFVTHPTLIGSAAGWVAESLGLDPTICIFFAYLLMFQLLLPIFLPLFWCIRQTVRLFVRGLARQQSSEPACGVGYFCADTTTALRIRP
ncbi:hypothetical protein [Bradyrhizobium australiense]|uniref:Uncharacterized protein n=1 Tax=Bradyrhizobium australiense TaxID=2721161 RepID=A0A7Y4GNS2_9BRAD|nr:hypothetical protein [Bradyrhizobium australiense]NOJ39066.1 hypothetical protein [Bradyrhizobium australiense]